MFAKTPKPPYYAVIFSSQLKETHEGYHQTADKMSELAKQIEGYLGVESYPRDEYGFGVTISYWQDEAAIKRWRDNIEHSLAREKGKKEWYADYNLRVAKVEREYGL